MHDIICYVDKICAMSNIRTNVVSFITVSRHITVFYTVLYCFLLCCSVLYYITSYHMISYLIISYHTMSCHIISYDTLLYEMEYCVTCHGSSLCSFSLDSTYIVCNTVVYRIISCKVILYSMVCCMQHCVKRHHFISFDLEYYVKLYYIHSMLHFILFYSFMYSVIFRIHLQRLYSVVL